MLEVAELGFSYVRLVVWVFLPYCVYFLIENSWKDCQERSLLLKTLHTTQKTVHF